jgi:hypothetical protein
MRSRCCCCCCCCALELTGSLHVCNLTLYVVALAGVCVCRHAFVSLHACVGCCAVKHAFLNLAVSGSFAQGCKRYTAVWFTRLQCRRKQ